LLILLTLLLAHVEKRVTTSRPRPAPPSQALRAHWRCGRGRSRRTLEGPPEPRVGARARTRTGRGVIGAPTVWRHPLEDHGSAPRRHPARVRSFGLRPATRNRSAPGTEDLTQQGIAGGWRGHAGFDPEQGWV